MDALKFFRKVDDDTLVIPMPSSYRGQEVEVIVLKKEAPVKPDLSLEEKLAILKQFEGSFPKWNPDFDMDEEIWGR